MPPEETSDALKRHCETFHLIRHDPEHLEQEKTSIGEKETDGVISKHGPQRVTLVVICED